MINFSRKAVNKNIKEMRSGGTPAKKEEGLEDFFDIRTKEDLFRK
jgi:biotin operon repressor